MATHRDVLSGIVFWLGGTVLIIEAADFFIRPQQKANARRRLEQLWYWLEEHRSFRYIGPLLSSRVLTAIPLACGVLGAVFGAYVAYTAYSPSIWRTPQDLETLARQAGVMIGLAALVGFGTAAFAVVRWFPSLLAWATGNKRFSSLIVRLLAVLLVTLALFAGFAVVTVHVLDRLPHSLEMSLATVLTIVELAFYALLGLEALLIAVCIVWWLAVSLLLLLMWLSETIVLWIVSYQRGPVLAVGAVLAGIAGAIRYLNGG